MAGHIESAGDVTWNTPEEILAPTREMFDGVIDLDPCGNDTSIVGATTTYMLPEQDGLTLPWLGKTFLNSPFGSYYMDSEKDIISAKEFQKRCAACDDDAQSYNEWEHSASSKASLAALKAKWQHYTIKDWIIKAFLESMEKAEIVQILPASVDTGVWHECIYLEAGAVCYLKGRVKYLCGGKKSQSAPMPCAILYWGSKVEKFKKIFSKLGHVDILKETP